MMRHSWYLLARDRPRTHCLGVWLSQPGKLSIISDEVYLLCGLKRYCFPIPRKVVTRDRTWQLAFDDQERKRLVHIK